MIVESLDFHSTNASGCKNISRSPLIWSRDFAYPNNKPIVLQVPQRMAEDNIFEFSAGTFAELLSGPTVDVYVGPVRKRWTLHKNLLCYHSSYFETELDNHEVDGNNESATTLNLPDDDPQGFALFVKWLYQGRLDSVPSTLSDEQKYEYAVACQKLYLLGSKFSIPALTNLAMDTYRSNLHIAQLVPDSIEMNEIYRAAPPNSKLRTLMAEIAARQIMDPDAEKDAESMRCCFEGNPDFAVEMVNAIRQMSGGILFRDPTGSGDDCTWHDHPYELTRYGTESNENKCSAKTTRPGVRKSHRQQSTNVVLFTQSTTEKPAVDFQKAQKSDSAASRVETLQPVTFDGDAPMMPGKLANTPAKLTSPKSRPRKLSRTAATRSPEVGTTNAIPRVVDDSRKVVSKPSEPVKGNVNRFRANTGSTAENRRDTSRALNPAREPSSANHVNGIVRRFNNMNGTSNKTTASKRAANEANPET